MNPSSRKKNPGDRTLSPGDLAQLKAAGITPAQVRRQIALLRKAGHHRELHRPCTIGDGIHRISPAEGRSLIPLQEEAAGAGRFLKFVPASGAASRMFEDLHYYHHQSGSFPDRTDTGKGRAGKPKGPGRHPLSGRMGALSLLD